MSPHIFFTFVVVLTAEGWGRRPRRIFAAGPSLLDPLRPPRLSAPHSAHGVGPAHPSSYRGKGGIFGLPRGITGEGQQSGGGVTTKGPGHVPHSRVLHRGLAAVLRGGAAAALRRGPVPQPRPGRQGLHVRQGGRGQEKPGTHLR